MSRDRELSEGLVGSAKNKAEVERTLLEITARASANAEGEVGVGLSIVVAGEVHSIGATTPSAQRMDKGQAEDGDGPCLRALRSGELVAVSDYAGESRWPSTSRRAAETGIRSSLSLPLKTREDIVLGALNVYSDSVNAFSAAAGSSLAAFAAQATTSLFLLGELQEQRDESAYVTDFSRTVQDRLRTVLPEVPGLELVGGSVPAASRAAVGGDWYDALALPDQTVGLVVGDVMGHDIEAVTTMAQLRTMLRAGAWLGHSPDRVLAMADELVNDAGLAEIATVFYGRLTRTGPSAQLEYCNAGHPQPLLRTIDGTVTALKGGRRVLLGTLGPGSSDVESHNAQVEIPPGSILLLYTDGLVEHDGVSLDDATDRLIQTLSSFASSAPLADLCEQLLASSNDRDDTTVLIVRT